MQGRQSKQRGRPLFSPSLAVLLLVLGLALPGELAAQTSTGAATGTARDSSGAVVPNVQVALTNINTGEKRTQVTSADGTYNFPLLPPGTYKVEAEHPGFRKFVRPDLTVEVQQVAVIDITLQVGATTQSVEVRAETPLLQPTTSSLGQVVDSRKMLDLPLVGRNTLALIGLTAGAQPVGPQYGQVVARTGVYAQGFVAVSGGQVLTSDTLIDGISVTGSVFNAPVYTPYNGHNKTFWFFSYEGLRDQRAFTQILTVPTPQQLQGDFSQTFNSAGKLITIADPATTRPDPSHPGSYLRDLFENNLIPANRIDAVAAKVRNLWPPPNTTGTVAGANNFIGNGRYPDTEDQVNVRIDHTIRQKHRLMGRFTWNDDQRGAFDFFHNGAGIANADSVGTAIRYNGRLASLAYTNTISPTLVMEIQYGFSRGIAFKDPAGLGADLTTLGFPASFNQQVFLHALPAFQPSGYRAIAPQTSDLLHRYDNAHSLNGSVTKVLPRHALKAGFNGRLMLDGELQPSAAQGVFNFDGRFTSSNPAAILSNSGQSVASFLLGVPSSGSIDFMPAISISYRYTGLYFQDDWKVSPKLTLNLGLRYDLQTARDERYDRLSWFDPNIVNPIGAHVGMANVQGGLEFAGVGGNPRRQENMPKDNFAPRFGFAYEMTNNTILRGGYGIYYLPNTGDDIGRNLGGEGFFATTPFLSSTNGGITPANYLTNPFPNGLIQPPGSALGLAGPGYRHCTEEQYHRLHAGVELRRPAAAARQLLDRRSLCG